jgi:predicted enzyme related to lactoylglutathione lyase
MRHVFAAFRRSTHARQAYGLFHPDEELVLQIPLGRFVSFDYVAPEPQKAQAFYGTVFGWTSQQYVAPLAMTDAPQSAHWLPLLQTPNAHESASKAKLLGGTMLREPYKKDGRGKQAITLDPTGAPIALWEPIQVNTDKHWTGSPGAICWAELYTKSPTAAGAFYKQLGGFTETKTIVADDTPYHLYERDGLPRAGVRRPMPDMPCGWFAWVRVDNVDRIVGQAFRLGATVTRAPMDMCHGSRMALLRDPFGAALGLIGGPIG